jgi:hypothetical protein
VIIQKQGKPYSGYLLITSSSLFAAAVLGVVVEYVRFYGFYSLSLDLLQECLTNTFSYAALFYALKFTIEITHWDWAKIRPAKCFLVLTYAALFLSYTLYRLINEWFFWAYLTARIVFWDYYFSLITVQFHRYANKLTDDVLLKFRLRLIEVGCSISLFYPFLAVHNATWRLSLLAALMAAIPYYTAYKTPKWLERKIELKAINENMLDKCLFLLAILSEHYTNATRSSKSLLVNYVKAFGIFLRLSDDDLDVLVKASYFLDVDSMQLRGESGIGSLKEPTHPMVSADFAKMLLETEHVSEITLHHHDRWDGRTIFNTTSGEEIPLGSRIIAIVECFVGALVNNGKDERLALGEVSKEAGASFDPNLVAQFSTFLKQQREDENVSKL